MKQLLLLGIGLLSIISVNGQQLLFTSEFGGDKSNGAIMSYDPATDELSTMASLGGNPHYGYDILIQENIGAPVQLNGGLTLGNDAYYYGVNEHGSAIFNTFISDIVYNNQSRGMFYRIAPVSMKTEVLHAFTGSGEFVFEEFTSSAAYNMDLGYPVFKVLEVSDGVFYGVAASGGSYNKGGIWKFDVNTMAYSKIGEFSDDPSGVGYNPLCPLIKGDGNNLYGVLRNKGTANTGYIYRVNTATDNLEYVADLSSVGWVIDEPFGDIIYNSDLNKIFGTKDRFDGGSNWGGGVYSFDIATGTTSNLFTITFPNLGILGNNATGIVQGNNGKMYALCKNGGANDYGTIIEYNLSGNSYIKVFDFPEGLHPKGTGLHVRGSQIYGAFETNNDGYALWSFDYISGAFKQMIPTSSSLPGYNMDFQTCIDNGKIIGRMKNGGIADAGSFFSYDLLTGQTTVLAENHSQEGRSLLGELTQLNDSILLGFTGMGGELEIPTSTKIQETGNLVQVNTKTGAITVLPNAWYGAFAEHQHKFKVNRPLVGSNNKLYYSYFTYGYHGGYHLAEYDMTSHTRVDYLSLGNDANIWETVGSIEISKGKIVTANQDSLYVYDFNSNTFSERKFTHDKDKYGTFHGNIKQASNGRIYGLTRAKPDKPYLDHKAVIYSMDTLNFTFKVEHAFDAIVRNCNAGLTELNGKLWGSTNYGGTNDHGYLFSYELSTGTFTVEHNFDRINDGAGFEAEWTPLNGKLYSTSYTGGQHAYGTLVEFDPVNTSNPFRVVKPLSMQNGRAFRASPMTYITKRIALDNNIDFVNPILIGQSEDANLTISNTGNSTLTVSGIDVPSGFSADWTSGTITSGGNQAVRITFSPTDDIDYSGTITVNGDQTSGTNSVSVSGSALLTSIPHEVPQVYSVYPNPAKATITIKGVDGLKRIELMDLLGRLIVFKEFNNNTAYYELNVSDQNLKGMFLLNIYSVKGKISSRKIVFE